MRSVLSVILVSLISSFAFSQKEDKKENKDNKETQNTKVTPGASGVKRSIGYRFSPATGDADPGKGIFRYNTNIASEVKYIFVDDIDIKEDDQTKWYRTWEDSTGASGRGQILVVKLNGEVVNIFDFTDVFTDVDGYWKFPVKTVSGGLPENDSVYYYIFNRIAHSGGEGDEKGHAVEDVEEVARTGDNVSGGGITVVTVEEPVVYEPKEEEAPEYEKVEEVKVVEEAVEVVEKVAEVVVEPVKVPEPEPVVVTAEVPVTEPVVEVRIEEAPVVIVPEVVPEPEPVVVAEKVEEAVEEKVAEAPKITDRKTKITDKPLENPETKVNTGDRKVLPNKIDEGIQTTLPEPKKETTIAQGSPRITETKPAEPAKEPEVSQNAPVIPETKPVQPTTTAAGPPRVTENKPASQTQGTTVPQGTQKPPVTQPAQETRPATEYQPARVSETPVTQSFAGSAGARHGKCYRGIIELGYGFRISEYGMNNFRFNFINGFNIRSTSIGLGIGVRKYYDKPAKHPDWHIVSSDVQIPVFLDVRTHFSSKKVTPYLGIGIGNAAGFDSDTTNNQSEGLYFHATGGIWFNLSERFAVFGGFAYETQRLRYANFSDEIIYNMYTNSLSLNIGIAF